MKIREKKRWSPADIRAMCIENEYCSNMTNKEYEDILDIVYNNNPTTELIYKVACDIVDGSDLSKYGQTYEENVETVMFEIGRRVFTFYSVEG